MAPLVPSINNSFLSVTTENYPCCSRAQFIIKNGLEKRSVERGKRRKVKKSGGAQKIAHPSTKICRFQLKIHLKRSPSSQTYLESAFRSIIYKYTFILTRKRSSSSILSISQSGNLKSKKIITPTDPLNTLKKQTVRSCVMHNLTVLPERRPSDNPSVPPKLPCRCFL